MCRIFFLFVKPKLCWKKATRVISGWRETTWPKVTQLGKFGVYLITHPSWTKWPPFRRQYFRCIFGNEMICILIKMSLKFVPLKCEIDNNTALVQIMAWCRIGDKPLFEPMLTCWRIYAALGNGAKGTKLYQSVSIQDPTRYKTKTPKSHNIKMPRAIW